MSIEFGIYPLTGIVLAGLLYGVYYLLIRNRCHPRTSQRYILMAVVASLLFSFIQPVKYVQRTDLPAQLSRQTSDGGTKEPLIVVDGKTLGGLANKIDEADFDNEEQLASMLSINPEDISSVTVLNGTPAKALYGSQGDNGVIEIETAKPSTGFTVITPDALKMMRYIYLAGLGVMLIYLLVQMMWLVRIRQRSTHMEMEKGVRVYDTDIPSPFSFAHSIFIPNGMEQHLRDDVFAHESEHLRHHHYAKLCVMQVLQAAGWFNPFIWLFGSDYKLQQEMEVDMGVMESGRDREQYQTNLLRICLHGNRWVQIMPAFGSSVIRQRLLFMNRWKPSQRSWVRILAASLAAFMILGGTAYAVFATKAAHCPLNGCWSMEWTRNTDSKEEWVPGLAGNMFYGNEKMCNFSWFGRYGGVNMRFNFSGEPSYYRNGKIYDYKGDVVDIKLTDENTLRKRWIRTPEMTALSAGPDITEQWRRTEPDKDVLHIIHSIYNADSNRSHRLCGVWEERPDTVAFEKNYFVVNTDIYARFTIYTNPKGYYCAAGGWCGEARHEADDKIFMSDRTSSVIWHDKDSITLVIPRDSGRLEPHDYVRGRLPEKFRELLTAADTSE